MTSTPICLKSLKKLVLWNQRSDFHELWYIYIRGMTDFNDQFRKIIMRYKRIVYNQNVMRQSACLIINPITIDGYDTLFNCTPVDRASDSMMAPT